MADYCKCIDCIGTDKKNPKPDSYYSGFPVYNKRCIAHMHRTHKDCKIVEKSIMTVAKDNPIPSFVDHEEGI